MAGFRNPLWRFTLAAAALALLVVTSGQARAGQKYSYSTFDVPGATDTQAFGINDSGQIVCQGYYNNGGGAGSFLMTGKVFTSISVPGAYITQACGINNSGQIVGTYVDWAVPQHYRGFLKNGTGFTTIDYPGASETRVGGINNSGQIVGRYTDATGYHSFVCDASGFTPINVPGANSTYASGINDIGQIVGAYYDATGGHNFLKNGTDFTTLKAPGASFGGCANGINGSGQIVGYYGDFTTGPPYLHAFQLYGTAYNSLDYPGAVSFTSSQGINNSGQIVGSYDDASRRSHGFLATGFTIEGILDFLDQSVAAGTLYGTGPPSVASVRLQAFGGSLKLVKAVLDHGDEPSARRRLKNALHWCDGEPSPPDFVAGPAAPELAAMIQNLMAEMVGM